MKRIILFIMLILISMTVCSCAFSNILEESETNEVPVGSEPSEVPEGSEPSEVPEESEPSEVPEESKPSEVPEDSKPSNEPEKSEPSKVPEESKPSEVPEKLEPNYEELMNQANSDDYNDWLTVAKSKYATEEMLKIVAKKVADYAYNDIVDAIIQNPNTTGAVMEKLALTDQYYHLQKVATSDKSNEMALSYAAELSACYGFDEISLEVLNNPDSTVFVLQFLLFSREDYIVEAATEAIELLLMDQANSNDVNDWLTVAKSEYATEEMLKIVAKKVADYAYNDIVDAIIQNPNTTGAVMEKLALTEQHYHLQKVATSDKSNEMALSYAAELSAYYGFNDVSFEVMDNPNTTVFVLQFLLLSRNDSVVEAATEAIKLLENNAKTLSIESVFVYFFKINM